MTDRTPARPGWRQRWLARLSLAAAAAAVILLLLFGGLKSITAVLLGAAGLALIFAAAWWFLAHRGVLRWLAGVVLVAAPAGIIAVYVIAGLSWDVAAALALGVVSVLAGRWSLR
ncbi:MAG: hypothetical protein ACRDRJ_35000, partial [Streptosporangiaceae bacterium]